MSHSKERSRPCPHETLCGALGEAESAMAGEFQPARGWGEGGELRAAPATQAQRCLPQAPALCSWLGVLGVWRMRTCLKGASWNGPQARNNDFTGNT